MRVLLIICAFLALQFSIAQEKEPSHQKTEKSYEVIIDGNNETPFDLESPQNLSDGKKHIIILKRGEDGKEEKYEWEGEGELPQHILEHMDHHPEKFMLKSRDNHLPKAFLGVMSKNADQLPADYVVITKVIDGSTAESMGLMEGDRIMSLDDQSIGTVDELIDNLRHFEVGDMISLVIDREGIKVTMTGELGERPKSMDHHKNVIRIIENEDFDLQEWDDIQQKIKEGEHFEIKVKEGETGSTFSRIIIIKKEKDNMMPAKGDDDNSAEKTDPDGISGTGDMDQLQLEKFNAFPNPTGNHVRINFQSEASPVQVSILDMSGKMFYQEDLAHFDGNYSRLINFNNASPGTYILRITQENQVFTHKILYQ